MAILYRRHVGVLWWTRRPGYVKFVVRELTSVFVAYYVAYLLFLLRAVYAGAAEYQAFLDWAGQPWVVALNVVALAMTLFHTVTWFGVTPQAMPPIRLMGERIPGWFIMIQQYAGWVTLSLLVAWIVLVT